MPINGLFVTGTDTGVGKTRVTAALTAYGAQQGLRIAALKPVESGVSEHVGSDADLLGRAGVTSANWLYRYELPLAPKVAAARQAATPPDRLRIRAWVNDHGQTADRVLVEAAGGWLVPLAADLLVADLAADLCLPVLVVARPSLGTINHTLLTLAAVQARGCSLAGFLISNASQTPGDVIESNVEEIARVATQLDLEAPYWGVLDHVSPTQEVAPLQLTPAAQRWFECST